MVHPTLLSLDRTHRMPVRTTIVVLGLLLLCEPLLADDRLQPEQEGISSILREHCLKCHGATDPKGELRLDLLATNIEADAAVAEQWQRVLEAIRNGEMPPAEEEQLSADQRAQLVKWIESDLRKFIDASAGDRPRLRKLTRVEYQNTMTDLLGIQMDFARELPADPISSDGFKNDAQLLDMTQVHLDAYLESARSALNRVIVSHPRPKEFHYRFEQSNVSKWKGEPHLSNQLGRQQQFLAKMETDYPEQGEFLVRVTVEAEFKPARGYPLLEVSVGYRPDTEILFREFPVVEVNAPGERTFEFRGWIEDFPLPVRGQGKFPGLVVRVRNAYDDGSALPEGVKSEDKKLVYPVETQLPRLNLRSVEFHGPAFETWPPAHHANLLLDCDRKQNPKRADVRHVLSRFAERAFRRPITKREVRSLLGLYDDIRDGFPKFEDAMREVLAYVLIQPDFLYIHRAESTSKIRGRTEGSDWELASRLSYFLWSSMPDQRLFDLSRAGLLREPEILSAEVDRMLRSSKSSAFITQFPEQWLALDLIENVSIDPRYHPRFNPQLKTAMIGESRQFFAELVRSNLSAMNFLTSDFTLMNEPLARHYGVEDVFGTQFRRVQLPTDQHRGGLLGHAGILLAGSTGADSHPVRRAVWIRDRLLNDPPAPPPANVPNLEAIDPEFHQLPMREKLEVHRGDPSCAGCHRDLDPWGIALENFDAVGLWRQEVRSRQGKTWVTSPVVSKDSFSSGFVVDGPDILKQYLAAEFSQQFARSLLSRMLTYALGRTPDVVDQTAFQELEEQFAAHDFRMRDLVHLIVASELFQGPSLASNKDDEKVLAP